MNCEWPTDKILRFIEEYKSRPLLWDRDHCHNRIPERKMRAWEEMAEIFNTDTWELKKKMDSLLASYRRERQKVKIRSAKLRSNGETDVSLSTWFAYPAFRFLHDKYLERKAKMKLLQDEPDDNTTELETSQPLIAAQFIKTEEIIKQDEEHLLSGLEEQEIDEEYVLQTEPPPRKRHKSHHEIVDALVVNHHEINATASRRRDHCDVFGEYLSEKLKSYDEHTKSVVEYLISNIVFQADMGKFKSKDFNYETLIDNVLKNVNTNS